MHILLMPGTVDPEDQMWCLKYFQWEACFPTSTLWEIQQYHSRLYISIIRTTTLSSRPALLFMGQY